MPLYRVIMIFIFQLLFINISLQNPKLAILCRSPISFFLNLTVQNIQKEGNCCYKRAAAIGMSCNLKVPIEPKVV